jgi:hypothetical protein
VTGGRRLAANRANARAGTGPRTSAGKARSAVNAQRHGLTLPVTRDPVLGAQVEALARAIAGADAPTSLLGLARAIAEAEIDLMRVRRARRNLMARLGDAPGVGLAALDGYERRSLSRRKFAVRAYDAARLVAKR